MRTRESYLSSEMNNFNMYTILVANFLPINRQGVDVIFL